MATSRSAGERFSCFPATPSSVCSCGRASRLPDARAIHGQSRCNIAHGRNEMDLVNRRTPLLLLLWLAFGAPGPAAEADRWWAHVRFLADDALDGRDTGSV